MGNVVGAPRGGLIFGGVIFFGFWIYIIKLCSLDQDLTPGCFISLASLKLPTTTALTHTTMTGLLDDLLTTQGARGTTQGSKGTTQH